MDVNSPDRDGPSFQLKRGEPTNAQMSIARRVFNKGRPFKCLNHNMLSALC
jgi:hypothetical protein